MLMLKSNKVFSFKKTTFTSSYKPSLSVRNFTASSDEYIQKKIDEVVKNNKCVLFMKGSPDEPRCGFSRAVATILDSKGAQYSFVDVLENPEIREGVKKYADWPTIPQLYVEGKFIGGCDIVVSLNSSGELDQLLQSAGVAEKPTETPNTNDKK